MFSFFNRNFSETSPFDLPVEPVIKEYNSELFKKELTGYLDKKQLKYDEASFKHVSNFPSKKQYIFEVMDLITAYEFRLENGSLCNFLQENQILSKGKHELKVVLVQKLKDGAFEFWTGHNPSELSWLLTKWRHRLENHKEPNPSIPITFIEDTEENTNTPSF